MNKSQKLQPVELNSLIHKKFGKSWCDIKEEIASQIVVSDLGYLFMSSGLLDKIKYDFNKVDDVDCQFDLDQSFLIRFFSCTHIICASHVYLRESQDEWGHDKGVDSQDCHHEVPYFAEGSLCVN